MFNIATLNPLRFIDTSAINFGFDGDFAVRQVLSYQNPQCYFQKWQRSDTVKLQILSNFVPTDLHFRNIETDMITGTAAWQLQDIAIAGQTFSVYELSYAMAGLPEGRYYADFSFTDEDELVHVLISEPLSVMDIQENTLLLKYKHWENDFDVIFDTDIEFQFRVEAAIKNFNPQNVRSVYTDQKINSTQLSATPYRTFKLFIGFQIGVPEWVFDKINWIQSVDEVTYNNIPYQVINEAKYEFEVNDSNSFMGGSIEVQPVTNKFSKYKIDTFESGNTFTPMQKVIPYYGVAGNLPVANYFKQFSELEKICVNKRSAAVITLLVGTTPGGDEIGEFEIDDNAFVQTIEWLFTGTTTVYLSGLNVAGTDCDVFLIYKQLDEPPVPIGDGGGGEVTTVGNGMVVIYEEVMPGDLNIDFDVITGLGRANTLWSGWVIEDGRNGTENRGGVINIGLKMDDPLYNEIGKRGGSKTHILTENNIPIHGQHFTDWVSGKRGQFGNGENVFLPKNIDEFGLNPPTPIEVVLPYLTTLYVKKIS